MVGVGKRDGGNRRMFGNWGDQRQIGMGELEKCL